MITAAFIALSLLMAVQTVRVWYYRRRASVAREEAEAMACGAFYKYLTDNAVIVGGTVQMRSDAEDSWAEIIE